MGAGSNDEDSLLMRAVDSVGRGTTLDEAFLSLVEVLRGPLELWHASLSVLEGDPATEPGAGKIVAAWSLAPSAFEPGTEVSLSITESTRASWDALRRGEILMKTVASRADSLVDSLLREQGVAAVALVPVHEDAAGVLALMVGSSAEGPLKEVGESFFRGLAAGVEERLVELLGSRAV